MQFLLDTHVLLWWLASDPQLSRKAYEILSEGKNIVYVSTASTWEIAIKKAIGKLKAPGNLPKILEENRFDVLPITIAHTQAVEKLPALHADPFDRMLVAQAKHEGLTLVTHDAQLQQYKGKILLV